MPKCCGNKLLSNDPFSLDDKHRISKEVFQRHGCNGFLGGQFLEQMKRYSYFNDYPDSERHTNSCILCNKKCVKRNFVTLLTNSINGVRMKYNVCGNCYLQITRTTECSCNFACTICTYLTCSPTELGIQCDCPSRPDEPCIGCKYAIKMYIAKEAVYNDGFPWHFWYQYQIPIPPNSMRVDLEGHYLWSMDNLDSFCNDPLYHRNCLCRHFYHTQYNRHYSECEEITKKDYYSQKVKSKKKYKEQVSRRKNIKQNRVSSRKKQKQYTIEDIVFAKSMECKPASSCQRNNVIVSSRFTISVHKLPDSTHDYHKEVKSLLISNYSLGNSWASKVCPRNEALYTEDFPRLPKIDTCSICCDRMVIPFDGIKYPEQKVVTTDCGHSFHRKCLMEWKKRSKKCPLCRKKI